MLNGEAVVDPCRESLVFDGARDVLAVVAHDHDLPLLAVEADPAELGLGCVATRLVRRRIIDHRRRDALNHDRVARALGRQLEQRLHLLDVRLEDDPAEQVRLLLLLLQTRVPLARGPLGACEPAPSHFQKLAVVFYVCRDVS